MILDIFIPGIPKPAGSKRAIPIYRGKKGGQRTFTGKTVVVDSSGQAGKDWRADVRAAVQLACKDAPFESGGLTVWMIFYMPRPKSHYGSGKNADKLKSSAPKWYEHLQKPDAGKLSRSVEDALTGVVWKDDCQLRVWQEKRWSDNGKPGVHLSVRRTEEIVKEEMI